MQYGLRDIGWFSCDTLNQYNQSKYDRRSRSRRIKCKILLTEYKNKIKHKTIKSDKELQRKQWMKYNNKKRQNKYIDKSMDIVKMQNNYWYIPIKNKISNPNEIRIGRLRITDNNTNRIKLKEELISISKRSFAHNECNKLPFDMNTFNGQCYFWYYILDKLNLVNKLICLRYLQKCDKIQQGEFVDDTSFISFNMIYTEHLFYILNEIDMIADQEFTNNYYLSQHVIMNKQQLIDILYYYNQENVGMDISGLIASFVMSKLNEILFHYKRDDELTQAEKINKYHHKIYYNDGHKIIDVMREDSTIINKIYDNKDLTQSYKYFAKLHEENETLRYVFDDIIKIVWYKFKEYYIKQKQKKQKIKSSMIYTILLYYIDNAALYENVTFDFDLKANDYRIWRATYKKVKKSPVLKNILLLINNSLEIYEDSSHRQSFDNIVKINLIKKLSLKCLYLKEFVQCITYNYYFNNQLFGGYCYDGYRVINFWINIWMEAVKKPNVEREKLEIVYELMLDHCGNYSFDLKEFIWNDIVPILVENDIRIMGVKIDYEAMNLYLSRYKIKYVNFYKEMLHLIKKLAMEYVLIIWKQEDEEYFEENILIPNSEDEWNYVHRKYHRRHLSKQIYFKRTQKPFRYGKYDKSHHQRYRKKMKKYTLKI